METLNLKQTAVLIGSLLGDEHIQKSPAKTGKCRLRFCHSTEQKQFVDWKYEIFKKPFCQKTKKPYFENRTKYGSKDYLFYTSYRNEFIKPHAIWYEQKTILPKPKFVKRIPVTISEILIDPLSLAVWYLDDGTKRSDTESCRIATQAFTKQDHQLLQDCLHENFGIDVAVEDWGRNKANQVVYSLAILSRGGNYKKFRDLIYPIVETEIPGMLYKLL